MWWFKSLRFKSNGVGIGVTYLPIVTQGLHEVNAEIISCG